MERILSLCIGIGTSLSLFAQLSPQAPAPLHRHMEEVNAQWLVQPALPVEQDLVIEFPDEATRIATHLQLVREQLLARTPEGLSAAQMHARLELLDDLQRYAEAGTFPQNHVLPYRNPVFIDPVGTACAVGQLMIESGDRALAEQISAEQNLAYVRELERPEVATWATEHGFSADELAWIQPGYPPQTVWGDMFGGADSTITAMTLDSNGDIIIAGLFGEAGGQPMAGITRWDGTQYHPLGTGPQGMVNDLIVFNNEVLAAGSFNNGNQDLAHWDGTAWGWEAVNQGMSANITDLYLFNGELYAAGESSGFVGTTHQVMHWSGNYWIPVGQPFNGTLNALGEHAGNLVVAGDFTEIGQFGGTPCMHVAELVNGQWQQLGNGLPDPVYALHDRNGTLLAGGLIFDGTNPGFGLALLSQGGAQWAAPSAGNGSFLGNSSNATSEVVGFAEHNGDLFLCGDFSVYGPWWNSDGSHVAQYIDATQDLAGVAWMGNGGVSSMASHNGQLVLGGDLSYVNFTLCSNLASSDLSIGLNERDKDDLGVRLSPVPAQNNLTVNFAKPLPAGITLEVVDASGRTVSSPHTVVSISEVVDVSELSPGTYFLRIVMQQDVRAIGFMKQ